MTPELREYLRREIDRRKREPKPTAVTQQQHQIRWGWRSPQPVRYIMAAVDTPPVATKQPWRYKLKRVPVTEEEFQEHKRNQRKRPVSKKYLRQKPQVCTKPFEEITHGTLSAYKNDHCRCLACKGANARYQRERREGLVRPRAGCLEGDAI